MRKLPLFLRLMGRRARKGPAARYDVAWEPAIEVPGADGHALMTDHYAPVTTEPCPTILLRAPYMRAGFPWNYLYGLLLAEQGFHVLLQNTRGTGGSGGDFHTWRNEAPDGQAAVEWIRKQPWFSGDLFTLGASYMAYTQSQLAADPPPEWRAAIAQVALFDPHPFFWPGGAFGLERSLVGGLGMFTNAATFRDNVKALVRMQRHLKRATSGLPLIEAYQAPYGGRRPEFERWLNAPDADDEYWAGADGTAALSTVEIPVSLNTGWHDLVTDQVIEVYARRRAAGLPVDLLIGPWTHTSALGAGWEETFAQALRTLRGGRPDLPVRVHIGGADEWRDLPGWPPAGRPLELRLGADLGAGPGSTTFRYDPADPTPSIGGALQSKTQGTRDNAPLEKRSDVRTFTGPALTDAVEVMGPVRGEFDATTTAASGDLFARLCDVDPAGKSINVCDGLARIVDGRTVVAMGSVAHRFRPGHRIRLLIAGGAHPRFLRNYGTGEPPAHATRLVPTATTVGHSSVLVLPQTERR